MQRRGFLGVALGSLGAVAAFCTSIPFVRSLLPSAKARGLGNPVEVDLGKIAPGELGAFLYRGAPMLVLHRTPEMLATLATTDGLTLDDGTDPESRDPVYVDPRNRAINPKYLVVRGVCTHLGCVPQQKGAAAGKQAVGDWWPGGFLCPCHGSGFDYAGRVIRGPAPRNLAIPPYRYAGSARIVIGEAPKPT